MPTKTIYHNYTTYPDITSSNRDAIVLCMSRILPTSFDKIFPEYRTATIRCTVNSLEQDTFSLEGEDCKLFLKQLEEYKYYYEGKHAGVYTGNLYHIDIIDQEKNEWMFTFIISDKAFLYTDTKQYRLEGDVKALLNGLQS